MPPPLQLTYTCKLSNYASKNMCIRKKKKGRNNSLYYVSVSNKRNISLVPPSIGMS